MIEVEIKLPVDELESVERILLQNGFKEAGHVREEDIYFDGERAIKKRDQALRIRETKDLLSGRTRAQINFKGKKLDDQTMTRQELETELGSAEIGHQLLSAIGFDPVAPQVVKDRKMLCREDMTACLDRVEGLGDFLELEILVPVEESPQQDSKQQENQRKQALDRIGQVLTLLGYSLGDTINTSYLSMLQRSLG